jgi:hypothetical protein
MSIYQRLLSCSVCSVVLSILIIRSVCSVLGPCQGY